MVAGSAPQATSGDGEPPTFKVDSPTAEHDILPSVHQNGPTWSISSIWSYLVLPSRTTGNKSVPSSTWQPL